MDTKPLERFATWARRELITAVEAQATAVLSAGSVARTERAAAIKTLENEISSHGREHVIDRVAYTWFNRIIAMRFMDARNYTDAGIVSPAQGQTHGQPEILADAKRGHLDTEVVASTRAADAIIGLLDGTRRSTDAEGEAYALLLTEHCRYWHKAIPFMFEREGDYTELLVPANLLADGSILSRAIEVLTEEVCDDVEVIGWLYQFYISERKDEVFAGFKKNKKAGADEIPAATQLFTPHWIVRYLVENSLGRLWMLNRPNSRIVDRMEYYIAPVDEGTHFLKIGGPEELTVIDPACGSGHMLTYAFDLLYAIYEEEGYAPSEIPSLILRHNLHGTEIDPRAGSLAAFALTMKARAKDRRFFTRGTEPQICVIEPISFDANQLDFLVSANGDRHAEEKFWNQFSHADTLGSLIQPDADEAKRAGAAISVVEGVEDLIHGPTLELALRVVAQAEILSCKYSVVIANPPYMGSRNMEAQLATFAKENYPDAKSDLMTMFMVRAAGLTRHNGWWGMINLPSWMSLSAFEKLRYWFLGNNSIDTMLHFGRGVFGSDFGSVGFVVENCVPKPDRQGIYRRLFSEHVEVRSNSKIESLFHKTDFQRYVLRQREMGAIPGQPIVYWLPPQILDAMIGSQGIGASVAFPTSPHKTGDNGLYVRRWWEVSASNVDARKRWVPYAKGGGARRWYGLMYDVVDWSPEALRFYADNSSSSLMRRDVDAPAGVTYSMLTSGTNTFRTLPRGAAFDMGGPGFFPVKLSSQQTLSIVNSEMARVVLKALNPTLNLQVRDVKQIPVPKFSIEELNRLEDLGEAAVRIAQSDWDAHECSIDFQGNQLVMSGVTKLEVAIDEQFQRNAEQTSNLTTIERSIDDVIWTATGVVTDHRGDEGKRAILFANVSLEFGSGKNNSEYLRLVQEDAVISLVSYAVGCMFGRFSLDEPDLILADQGASLQDYLAKVPSPTFRPDSDNVIPFVDDGWFEDDIVERFRHFLRTAFGTEHFEENLRFVEEALGVKTLRDYFITKVGKSKFYDDHVQRYKNRPIYWMFSSAKGAFSALVYMHRYTPSTVSTVLNEYLREYRGKLEVALQNAEKEAAGGGSAKAQNETDRIRKVLVELAEYEHDVLYPLATQQVAIDLDDGVKANYPKFGKALKPIKGLEVAK